MYETIKNQVNIHFPVVFEALKRTRQVYLEYEKEKVHKQYFGERMETEQKLASRLGHKVVRGVFEGMKYIEASYGSIFASKLMGSYEEELQPYLRDAIEREYKTMIDIGCAEGFYTTGFAMNSPRTAVHGIDVMYKALRLSREMAELNNCSNVQLHKKVDAKVLEELITEKTLIICDSEGFEEYILNPEMQPLLLECDLLVEVHDHLAPGVSEKLWNWYKETHHMEWIDPQTRSMNDYRKLFPEISDEDLKVVLNEERHPDVCWLSMRNLKHLA